MRHIDNATRRLRVFRYKRGDPRGEHFELFDVPDRGADDAARRAAVDQAPPRRRASRCATPACTRRAGRAVSRPTAARCLACVTPRRRARRAGDVEPLANIPVLTDLVADMGEFYARFPASHPFAAHERGAARVRPGGGPRDSRALRGLHRVRPMPVGLPGGRDRPALRRPCGARHGTAPARGAARRRPGDVLAWAARPDGVWSCHAAWECTQACPAGLNPAERIMAPARRPATRGRRMSEHDTAHASRRRGARAPRPGPPQGPGPAAGAWLTRAAAALGGRAFALHRLTGAGARRSTSTSTSASCRCFSSARRPGATSWRRVEHGVPRLRRGPDLPAALPRPQRRAGRARRQRQFALARQRALFWAAMAIGAAALAYAAFHLLGGA